MTAAVTNSLRNVLLDLLKSDVGTTKYYVGLSRARPFQAPSDVSTRQFQLVTRQELQSVKVVSNSSFVIPTVNWASGSIYNTYSDSKPNQTQFYVTNSSNEVFLVVKQPKNDETGQPVASTVEPTATLAGNKATSFKTSDGYFWRFLYELSTLQIVNFRTSAFTPVQTITSTLADLTIDQEERQKRLQDSAVGGEILSLLIDSSGVDYVNPTITITGNGDSASFSAIINSAGQIVDTKVDSSGTGRFFHGYGYDYAKVTVTDTAGSGAVLKPIFGPVAGTSADPVATLKSKQIMLQTDFINDEEDTILTENDFNQIALIRGPKKFGSDSDFTNSTGNALKYFTVSASASQLPEDERFEDAAGTQAKVFFHDNVDNLLYYFQNDSTGYGDFSTGTITGVETNSISMNVTALNDPDIDAFSGDILYINNVDQIDRASTQTEDIRVIIQLG